jgi:hypothetical protein
MKKIANWFKITWRRLKSKTPPYFLTWAFVMALFTGFVTLLEEARTEEYLPDFFEENYNWIKFVYRGIAILIPLLATQNIVLSKTTTKNYEENKPEIKAAEAEIRHPREPPIEDQKNDILGSSRFEP